MIFTRRFGALAARPTFQKVEPAIDYKEYEARLAAEHEVGAAPTQKVHHLHLHLPGRKHAATKKDAA